MVSGESDSNHQNTDTYKDSVASTQYTDGNRGDKDAAGAINNNGESVTSNNEEYDIETILEVGNII